MARALVTFERTGDGGWRPAAVWLASKDRLEAKALPGDSRRENWKNALLRDAQRPRPNNMSEERGTWEDWIDWALNALANGHDSWAIEVEPELTLKALYEREILQVEPQPMTPPNLRPSTEVPEGLSGYRKVEPL